MLATLRGQGLSHITCDESSGRSRWPPGWDRAGCRRSCAPLRQHDGCYGVPVEEIARLAGDAS